MRSATRHVHSFYHLAFLILLVFSRGALAKSKPQNAILLSSIKALTFRAGESTTARRVSAIPQLNCVGGSARGLFEPDTIRCTNSGSSYSASDIEWTCQASLPPEFKLGSTDVVCEGYDSPQDDHILKGSCGLEYRLILTDLGEEKFGRGWFRQADRASRGRDSGGSGFPATLFWVLFVAVVAWMVYNAFIRDRGPAEPRPPVGFGGGGGGWGGGGDDGSDDPPPPYSPQKPRPSARGATGWGGAPRTPRAPRANQGWRPGFWTGMGAGAAATHLAGRAFGGGGGRQQQQPSGGGWGWGGGGGDAYRGESSAMGRRSGGGLGSSSPSYSSSRQTSTGFGGTTRR